jgi:phosphoglycolate phosphatase-like HAD superfamily hydrolase
MSISISWDVDGNLITTDQRCRPSYVATVKECIMAEGIRIRHSDEQIIDSLEEAAPGTGWPAFATSGARFLKDNYQMNIRPTTVELVFNSIWLNPQQILIPSAIASLRSWVDFGATNVIATGSDLQFIKFALGGDILGLFHGVFTRSTPNLAPKPDQEMANEVSRYLEGTKIHIGDTYSDVLFAERMGAVPIAVPHRYSRNGLRNARCIMLSSHAEFVPTNTALLDRIVNW